MRKNNSELLGLFEADQKDRKLPQDAKWLRWVSGRDYKRRKRVSALLGRGEVVAPNDFFRAAMIFQHGTRKLHIKMARQLARRSMALGSKKGKWLYAAATDRLLVMKGLPQRFGTQYKFKRSRGQCIYYELLPVDKRTTDAERIKYGVKHLKRIKKIIS